MKTIKKIIRKEENRNKILVVGCVLLIISPILCGFAQYFALATCVSGVFMIGLYFYFEILA